ncbi:vacuolar protein sorting-associated protein 37A isoform X1 [Strongylocentrotus purpuratus]|uniref:VPS37 C-terminal domain-containing protein n=2 Tax=Strongylocentrotus purpuratus TaxID=7668 RepID=A0A7M7SWE5_STRPU|nr:vacuolar protein sorting-associated protein 37A isoform X1 [Strongylocentrotus purpuratus]
MSWFPGFGAPKSNLPAVTPLQAQRSKQIDSLRALNPNVVELKRDEEYRVGFTCGVNHVTFTISLPADFPQTKPIITVAPPMRHGFLDESMQVVRYLPLINFNVQTDLGRLVQNMVQEFCKAPMFIQPDASQQRAVPTVPQYQHFMPQPTPTQQQLPPLQHPVPSHNPLQQHQTPPHSHQPTPPHHSSPHMTPPHPSMALPHSSMTTPHSSMATATPPNQYTPQMPAPHPPSSASSYPLTSTVPVATSSASSSARVAPVNGLDVEPNIPVPGMLGIRGLNDGHHYNMPAIPPSFNDLFKDYTKEQLQDLIEDDDKLDVIFRNVPQLSKMHIDRTELYQSCEEIAKLNLSYQPEIERLRREVEETVKFRNDLKNNFDMKCLQQQSLNEQCSLSHLMDNMRVSAADAEHQSDDLAERFLQDKVTLDEFLKLFSEQRKLLHIRKVKEEKLSQLIEGQGRY